MASKSSKKSTTTSSSKGKKSSKKQISSSSEPAPLICCLKECGKAIDTKNEGRAEMSVNIQGFVRAIPSACVAWERGTGNVGRAVFHTACFDFIEDLLAERNSKKKGSKNKKQKTSSSEDDDDAPSGVPQQKKGSHPFSLVEKLTAKEAELLEEGAETVEFIDGLSEMEKKAKHIAALIKAASFPVVFTGAGISTSTGIGDYRGKEGKWTQEDTGIDAEEEGIPYERLRPSIAHEVISKLMEKGFIKYVISQNCDGLHVLSGVPLDKISELHGNVYLERCEKCDYTYERNFYVLDDEAEDILDGVKPRPANSHVDKCLMCDLNHYTARTCDRMITKKGETFKCDHPLRDTIINFGDLLGIRTLMWAKRHARQSDLMLSIGSSMTVTPACSLVTMGKRPHSLAIINRQRTDMDSESTPEKRVFGDIDPTMRLILAELLSKEEYEAWEDSLPAKRVHYDTQRADL